jgi:hypothetical protein
VINLIFSLQYQQQLRQTRRGLCTSIEKSIVSLIDSCGGKVQHEQNYLRASFDEQSIAFWLDMLILIEKLDQILKAAADELYGHICLITSEIIDINIYSGMLQELAAHGKFSGIWLAKDISAQLHHYFYFDDAPISFITKNYFDVTQIKRVTKIRAADEDIDGLYPLREKIIKTLNRKKQPSYNILFSPDYFDLKDGLYHFMQEQLGEVPPLVFKFGSEYGGLSGIADALGPEMKQFLDSGFSAETMKQLESLQACITRERLRSEYPQFIQEKCEQFLSLLIDTYIKTSNLKNIDSFIVIDNIDKMDEFAHNLMIQKVKDLQLKSGISICCTTGTEQHLSDWEELQFETAIFPSSYKKTAQSGAEHNLSKDMKELWEIAYMCFLMQSFFPKDAFISLFNDEGKNPELIFRAFEILSKLGIITSLQDPEILIVDFEEKAEEVLGSERILHIKMMVKNRILAWVRQEKLLPCFNLITALAKLDGNLDDDIIIDSIYQDIIDGVYSGLQKNIDSGDFHLIVGEHRVSSLVYIFHTLVSLIHSDEETIRKTFASSPPNETLNERYTSYIESNKASYQLSTNDLAEAAKSIKKAMISSQNRGNSRGGARAFRLYALQNVIQGNLTDAAEYLQFAEDHAKRSKDWEEASIISYYSAVVQFLFGNISKAHRFANLAEEAALSCGMISWEAKSRFLKGRILFEQGKYFDAYDVFTSIIPTEKSKDTLDAWRYRAKMYAGGILLGSMKNEGDGAIFLIEAAYMNHEYEKTIALADEFLVHLQDHHFIFLEQADWQSGFSQIELLMFPQKDFLHRLVSAYRALALSHRKAEESVSIMQQITRDKTFHVTDIDDAFYFFAQYQVLQNTDASEIDLNTAISMAFKRFQRRASRIDDTETKRAFLSQNRWNKALGEAAKYHRLI